MKLSISFCVCVCVIMKEYNEDYNKEEWVLYSVSVYIKKTIIIIIFLNGAILWTLFNIAISKYITGFCHKCGFLDRQHVNLK